MTKLILLDRDGVINFDSPDYIKSPDEWVPIPGALQALAALKRAGIAIAVCTNQSGIGRGLFTTIELDRIHDRMRDALARQGATFDALHYCPHHPADRCRCRKPEPGMLLDAMHDLDVSPADTLFVGDSARDLEAAARAGCRAALVRTGNGRSTEAGARLPAGVSVYDDLAALTAAMTVTPQC